MTENDPIDPIAAAYRWCWQHEDLLTRFPGQVVVYHNRTFLGSGADHLEAMENARQRAAEQGKPLPANSLLFINVPDRDESLSPLLPLPIPQRK